MTKKVDIDWNNLGFEYIKTDFRYISNWKDGKWDHGHLTEDNMLKISERHVLFIMVKHALKD